MKLEDYLARNKGAILERWFQLLVDSYPNETARFLRQEKKQFANPVGYTYYQGLEGLYNELLQDKATDRIYLFLDQIFKVRAVQDLSPSQAISFIFMLKKIIREELAPEVKEEQVSYEELLAMDAKIDDLALLSFDVYMQCRERLCQVRINEVKNRTYRLLQRANLIADN